MMKAAQLRDNYIYLTIKFVISFKKTICRRTGSCLLAIIQTQKKNLEVVNKRRSILIYILIFLLPQYNFLCNKRFCVTFHKMCEIASNI